MTLKLLKSHQSFDGEVRFWSHHSKRTATEMKFSTYTPPGKVKGCLIWLSGLTCNEEVFVTKAGAQKYLSEAGIMLICPDTSPRGLELTNEHEDWDFGSGAGFYVDALTPGYKDHYRMYSYVSEEVYSLLQSDFGIRENVSISGHSMGGHGALVLGLREPEKFRSVSAFAPIVNPLNCPWGQKAFAGYLGEDQEAWKAYDSCELVRAGRKHSLSLLVDQGTSDQFLEKELLSANLENACKESDQALNIRYREGYDHSYYFIATYISQHIAFHAEHL